MIKYVNADKMLEEYEHSIYDTTDLAEMLYYMPAADVVEVRHGRWEKTGTKRYYNDNDMMYVDFELKCSCCGKLKWMSEQQQPIDNYCPNCGAQMDLEEK